MPTRAASLRRRHDTSTAGRAGMWRRCALALLGTTVAAGACSRSAATTQGGDAAGGSAASSPSATPAHSAFFLTEEQRARIHTVTITPSTYRPTDHHDGDRRV